MYSRAILYPVIFDWFCAYATSGPGGKGGRGVQTLTHSIMASLLSTALFAFDAWFVSGNGAVELTQRVHACCD